MASWTDFGVFRILPYRTKSKIQFAQKFGIMIDYYIANYQPPSSRFCLYLFWSNMHRGLYKLEDGWLHYYVINADFVKKFHEYIKQD